MITRFSADPRPPANACYGTTLGDIRADAIPVIYDQAAWLQRFHANWPAGIAAYRSYAKRISDGPDFSLDQAARLREPAARAQPGDATRQRMIG